MNQMYLYIGLGAVAQWPTMSPCSASQLRSKAVLVNYLMKTGQLWSPQNVSQYRIIFMSTVCTVSTLLGLFQACIRTYRVETQHTGDANRLIHYLTHSSMQFRYQRVQKQFLIFSCSLSTMPLSINNCDSIRYTFDAESSDLQTAILIPIASTTS